jgi:hypothetical protein
MKTVASIEEIRAEIELRIDTSTWGRGYCVGCPAPLPYRIVHEGIAKGYCVLDDKRCLYC